MTNHLPKGSEVVGGAIRNARVAGSLDGETQALVLAAKAEAANGVRRIKRNRGIEIGRCTTCGRFLPGAEGVVCEDCGDAYDREQGKS